MAQAKDQNAERNPSQPAHPYDRLGVPTALNAAGTVTRLGGTRMHPAVLEAMRAASERFVPLDQLHAAVGERIAMLTRSEAALVTTGAAAGLTLAAAACIAGDDYHKMDQLPSTSEMASEIVVPRSHRNGYDHALRAAGARLVEIGLAERTRDPQPWEFDAAVGESTVAIAYSVGFSPLPLETAVAAARRNGVPLIVDAAAALPPRSNLHAFCDAGADLVVFSGGKAIRGPQASGILCGRRNLIQSAALQMWDLDLLPSIWKPPHRLFGDERANGGIPNHGIGRSMKVGKEEIVGLWAAIERFATGDDKEETDACTARTRAIASEVGDHPGVTPRRLQCSQGWEVLELEIDAPVAKLSANDLLTWLETNQPIVCAGQGFAEVGRVTVDPFCLTDDEAKVVGQQIRNALQSLRARSSR